MEKINQFILRYKERKEYHAQTHSMNEIASNAQ